MTIEQLIRAHRELALMMGYQEGPKGHVYTYRMFMDDINILYPGCVISLYKMWDVMTGRNRVPKHWDHPINQLLELALGGQTHPPRPGPYWHPAPIDHLTRDLAATRLDEWLRFTGITQVDLERVAELGCDRVSRLRSKTSPFMPTELDRIAAAFNTDRAGFLAGVESVNDEGAQSQDEGAEYSGE